MTEIKKVPKCRLTEAQEEALVLQLKRLMNSRPKISIVDIQDSITEFFISKRFPVDPTKKVNSAKAYGFLKKHEALKNLFWEKKESVVVNINPKTETQAINPFSYNDIPTPPTSDCGDESKIKLLEEKISNLEKSLEKYNTLFDALAKKNFVQIEGEKTEK